MRGLSFGSSRGKQRRVLGFVGVSGLALVAFGHGWNRAGVRGRGDNERRSLDERRYIERSQFRPVNHAGDADGEFFGDTACATEIAIPNNDGSGTSTVYGPASIPAGNSPGGFVPVSQNASGSGTSGDPFRIITIVDVGTTGLEITETDTYVVGQESYRTDVRSRTPPAPCESRSCIAAATASCRTPTPASAASETRPARWRASPRI